MSTYARVVDGVAVEVWTDGGLDIDPADVFVPELAEQFEPVPIEVQTGWTFYGSSWQPPTEKGSPTLIPQEVSMRQARVALHLKGLLSDASAAIESFGDEITKIEWHYAQVLKRDWPALETIASLLNLSSSEVDDLFIFANTL